MHHICEITSNYLFSTTSSLPELLRTSLPESQDVKERIQGCYSKSCHRARTISKAGEKLHGFTLLRSKNVPELELTALHLQHDKTGADYLHVAREDKNNVFSIGFKTNPPDDTGVPHILEHTTLCGSEK